MINGEVLIPSGHHCHCIREVNAVESSRRHTLPGDCLLMVCLFPL